METIKNMACQHHWSILLALLCVGAFANDPLDCVCEHLVNLTLAENEVRKIGNQKCETIISIENAQLAKHSVLQFNHGNYTIKRFEQNERADSQWFRTSARINTLNVFGNASIQINNSALINRGPFHLEPDAKLTIHNSNITIKDGILITNPQVSFKIKNNSSLKIKGNIVFDLQNPTTKRTTFISSKESTVYFSRNDIELRTTRRVYVPSDFLIVLVSHVDSSSRQTGSFRLILNDSIARKFVVTKGAISRPNQPDTYSKAASEGEPRKAAKLLDELIPLAEADPTGREAMSLAYFDYISDQSFYDQEVMLFQQHSIFGRLYPVTFLERFIPTWQVATFLVVIMAIGAGLHHILPADDRHLYW